MKVLDLYSGLGGWSAAFKDRGHEVVTVDIDYRLSPTYVRDIGKLDSLKQFGDFDIILASPLCTAFSLASAFLHWKGHKPDLLAMQSIDLVNHTIELIQAARPKYWVMENPRGMLRKVIGLPAASVDQCAYGREFKKPTDLWGTLPASFEPKQCIGPACSHTRTYKSQKDGRARGGLSDYYLNAPKWQRMSMRAKIPYGLSLAMCIAAEKDLERFWLGD